MLLTEAYNDLVFLMEGTPFSGAIRDMERWLKTNGWSKQTGSGQKAGYTSTWTRGFVKNPSAVADTIRRVHKFSKAVKGQVDNGKPSLLRRVRVYNPDTRRMNTLLRFEIGRPGEYSFGVLSLREPGIAPHRPKKKSDPRQQTLQ